MDTLTNQEFLYRENPVAYDGTGTITSIKGNTVSFNQLVQNGNFADTSNWSPIRGTGSVSNNVYTYTVSEVGSGAVTNRIQQDIDVIGGHKYYIKCYAKASKSGKFNVGLTAYELYAETNVSANTKTLVNGIISLPSITYSYVKAVIGFIGSGYYAIGDSAEFSNFQIYDLTLMGIDNLTTTAEVEAYIISHLGNLDYFGFTLGTLIPFMGSGLKTTGKNLCDNSTIEIGWYDGVGNHNLDSAYRTSALIPVLPNTTYIATLFDGSKTEIGRLVYTEWDGDGNVLSQITSATITTSSKTAYIRIRNFANQTSYVTSDNFLYQLEIGSTATAYEPYISNTLSLPTLTYFPSGMKSAGSVYDELSDKTYTRIKRVDLGSLDWSKETYGFYSSPISDMKAPTDVSVQTILCASYAWSGANKSSMPDKSIRANYQGTTALFIVDSSYSSGASLKTSLSGVYLYYELATPIETDISEDLTYPVWDGGTEQIYPTPLLNGQVDLGSLNWNYGTFHTNNNVFYVGFTDTASAPDWDTICNLLCSKYKSVSFNTIRDSINGMVCAYDSIIVYDSNYSDATTFKNAMSGVMLYYESTSSIPTTAPILCDIDYRGLIPVNAVDDPDGSGIITGTGNYRYHSMATLMATPTDEIYRFLRWEDENGNTLSTDATYTFEVGE